MHLQRFGALVLVCLATACGSAADGSGPAPQSQVASVSQAPMENFREVRPGLYRGGHPDTAGMDYLKGLGVSRVLNLEVEDFIEASPADIAQELDDATARGMAEHRYPMSAFEPAASARFDEQMNEILALLATASPEDPIYVHCKHGRDRTGLVVALERVFDEQWSPADAHDEMIAIGFRMYLAGLNHYFEEKTGYED